MQTVPNKPLAQGDSSLAAAQPAAPTETSLLKLARLVSLALHPFLVAPLSIVLILWLDSGQVGAAVGWALLCAALVVGPALLYLRQKLRRQEYSDADVSISQQRHGFYAFGGAWMVLTFGVLLWLQAPTTLLLLFTSALLTIAVFAVTTRLYTKVSIHAGAMAGIAAAAAFYSLPLAALLALGGLLVTWSRLVLKRHTPLQAALGWLIAGGIFGLLGAYGALIS